MENPFFQPEYYKRKIEYFQPNGTFFIFLHFDALAPVFYRFYFEQSTWWHPGLRLDFGLIDSIDFFDFKYYNVGGSGFNLV